MKKITITIDRQYAEIEYGTLRSGKLRYGIRIIEGTLKYCPEFFGIDYNPKKDEYSFVNDSPKNIEAFEIRRHILVEILKKEKQNWENIKWEVDPETYLYNIL